MDYQFTDANGMITISFGVVNPNWVVGPQIFTFTHPYTHVTTYYLRLTVGTLLNITANNGAKLKSFDISEFSSVGSLGLAIGQPGVQSSMNKHWDCNGADISSVQFQVTGDAAEVHQLTINYTEPSAILHPWSSSIQNGDTVNYFKSLILSFDSNMSIQDTSGISMTYNGESKNLSSMSSGSDVILSVNDTIKHDGTIDIDIPARCFRNNQGYENVALHYTFNIKSPRNTFAYDSISPKEGEVTAFPDTITLTYPKAVKITNQVSTLDVFLDGEPEFVVNITMTDDPYSVFLTHSGTFTKKGKYVLDIPEGIIHTGFYDTSSEEKYDRWNNAFSLEYLVVENTDITPDTPDNPISQDSEVMIAAKELLRQTGLGYPSEDSEVRKALLNLTQSEEIPADEVLLAYIDSFYNDTVVTMPVPGKWYRIAGENSVGAKLYLSLADGGKEVIVTENEQAAAAFMAFRVDGDTVVFQTQEGKYLHILTTLPNYDLTSKSNLSDSLTKASKLIFKKFLSSSVVGVSSENLLGKFTMKGCLGKKNDREISLFALLNYADKDHIKTVTDMSLHYDNTLSSAFVLSEVDEPAVDPEVKITPDVALNPGLLKNNKEKMTLEFRNVDKVQIADNTKPYFIEQSQTGSIINPTGYILSPVDGSTNQFTVSVNGLADNLYKLVLPPGTFSYDKNPLSVDDVELVIFFQIETEGGSSGVEDDPIIDELDVDSSISFVLEGSFVYEGKPSVADNAEYLSVVFTNVGNVEIAVPENLHIVDANGEYVMQALLNGTGLNYNFSVSGLSDGDYTLVIPSRSLICTIVGTDRKVTNPDVALPFHVGVNSHSDDTSGFNFNILNCAITPVWVYGVPVSENDVRNFCLSHDFDVYTNPDTSRKTIQMVRMNPIQVVDIVWNPITQKNDTTYRYEYKIVAEGHFVPTCIDVEGVFGDPTAPTTRDALQAVFDDCPTTIPAGDYTIIIQEAAFGDKNYGKYIGAVPTDRVPSKSECRVNVRMTRPVTIEDDLVTAIPQLRIKQNDVPIVFDLQGRRQTGKLKPGLYIVNGKKKVVR